MKIDEAINYWRNKLNLAKNFKDEHWYAEERHTHANYIEAMETVLYSLFVTQKFEKDHWFSVKEQLPIDGMSCLVYRQDVDDYSVAVFEESELPHWSNNNISLIGVTHWIPIIKNPSCDI